MSTAGWRNVDLLDLAYPYALDAVTDSERDAIERRRARADRAAASAFDSTVWAVRETLAALSVIDSRSAPAELEYRVRRALDRAERLRWRIDSTGHSGGGRDRTGRGGARRRGIGRGGAGIGPLSWLDRLAIAVVLVAALGAFGFVLVQHDSGPPSADVPSVAEIDARGDALTRTVPLAGGGEIAVHSSAALSAAAIEFRGVPAPPVGRSYQVWLVPFGGTPRSVAVVDSLPRQPLSIRFEKVDTLAITVEPAGGSPQPTETPIAALDLA